MLKNEEIEQYKYGYQKGREDFINKVTSNLLVYVCYPTVEKNNYFSYGYYDGFVSTHQLYLSGVDVLKEDIQQQETMKYLLKQINLS